MKISRVTSSYVRAFACICIVLHHFCCNNFADFSTLREIFINIGSANVSLFLMLSGYGLYMSSCDDSISDWWQKRFNKIYVPYLFVTMIYFFYYVRDWQVGKLTNTILLFCGIVTDYNWDFDRSMWYITQLWMWYLLFFCVFKVTRRLNDWHKVLILFGIATIFHRTALEILPSLSQVIRWSCFGFPVGVLWGVCARNYCKNSSIVKNYELIKSIIMMGVGILVLLFFTYIYLNKPFTDDIYVISSFLYSVGLIGIVEGIVRLFNIKRCSSIGNISYYIYLIHMKTMVIIAEWLRETGNIASPAFVYDWLRIAIYFLITLFIAYLLKRLFIAIESSRQTHLYKDI